LDPAVLHAQKIQSQYQFSRMALLSHVLPPGPCRRGFKATIFRQVDFSYEASPSAAGYKRNFIRCLQVIGPVARPVRKSLVMSNKVEKANQKSKGKGYVE